MGLFRNLGFGEKTEKGVATFGLKQHDKRRALKKGRMKGRGKRQSYFGGPHLLFSGKRKGGLVVGKFTLRRA